MNIKKVYSTINPELLESSSECFNSKYIPLSFSNYEVLLKIWIMKCGIGDLVYSHKIRSVVKYNVYGPHTICLTNSLGSWIKKSGSK